MLVQLEKVQFWVLFVVMSVLPEFGHAAGGVGGLSKFDSLVSTLVTWAQGIGLVLAMGGFVLAGVRFLSGEHDAKEKAKSVFVGSVIIAGSSVIVGFIKGALS